jgi:hypothetical protein
MLTFNMFRLFRAPFLVRSKFRYIVCMYICISYWQSLPQEQAQALEVASVLLVLPWQQLELPSCLEPDTDTAALHLGQSDPHLTEQTDTMHRQTDRQTDRRIGGKDKDG